MKFLLSIAAIVLCLDYIAAGRPSTKYLPPNFAGLAASGYNQYPPYHSLGGGGGEDINAGNRGHHYTAAATNSVPTSSQYVHNRAAVPIPILRSDFSNDASGGYNFGFETGNGIRRDEAGNFQGSWPGGALNIAGSYSYTGADGKLYSVNYKADKNGFHAEGDHLPTPPPIPREIQETLHLHQRGGNHFGSAASYSLPSSYTVSGHQAATGNFAAASHSSAANVRAPHANYLPPQQGQGYNYGRHR